MTNSLEPPWSTDTWWKQGWGIAYLVTIGIAVIATVGATLTATWRDALFGLFTTIGLACPIPIVLGLARRPFLRVPGTPTADRVVTVVLSVLAVGAALGFVLFACVATTQG